MNIKDLEQIMIKQGLVIRAISDKRVSCNVVQTSSGKIQKAVVSKQPLNTGRFLVEQKPNVSPSVFFSGQKVYESLEDIVRDLSAQP